MYIDTHCHLNFKAFNKDLDEVIKRAGEKGVAKIVIPGAKLDSSEEAIKIAQKNTCCFATVGIHPHHAKDSDTTLLYINVVKRYENSLLNLAKKPKVVAIGEIGLDYYQYKNYPQVDENNKKNQKELLLMQLRLAQFYKKPVILHCREALDDLIDLLSKYQKNSSNTLRGVCHCFAGNKTHLKKVLAMGFYVGFDGNITYKENRELQEVVKETPLDRLLLETDAPYLSPIPKRGQRNEPAYIRHTASFIAKLKETSLENLASYTFNNACSLFNL